MESEAATAAIIGGYWQATAVIIGVVVLAVGAFSLVSLWAGRHIDAKFDKHAAATDAKFDAMDVKFDAKFDKFAAATDAKFDAMDAKFEAKFDAMDAKFDKFAAATDAKMDRFAAATDAKFDAMGAKMDTVFERIAAVMETHRKEVEVHRNQVEAAIARGTKEHEDWRVEMKAVNERVTDLYIEREVDRRMQASRGGTPAAGSDGEQG